MDIFRFTPWNWFSDDDTPRRSLPQQGQTATGPVDQLHNDIDRLFQQAWGGFASPAVAQSQMLRPRLDVKGDDKEYKVSVELPGVAQDQVKIELRDQSLIISGEKKSETKEEKDGYYHTERSFGSFRRILGMPEEADVDAIKATQKDGVLTIIIPRQTPEKAAPKQIEISKE